MTTPINPTTNYQLDTRSVDGDPFPRDEYSRNMGIIDSTMAANAATAASKVNKSGDTLTGTLNELFEGLWQVLGSNSDKFAVQRENNNVSFVYNANFLNSVWSFYNVAFPAFKMSFTQAGALQFFTAPPGPSVIWTEICEINANNLESILPFLAVSSSQFNGAADFKSAVTMETTAQILGLLSAVAGFNATNTGNFNFEGLWSVFGTTLDKFRIQRAESSVYLTYNLFYNGTSWVVGDSSKGSLSFQFTSIGNLNVRYAAPNVTVWTTLFTFSSTNFAFGFELLVNAVDVMAEFGTNNDKLTISKDGTGNYHIAYNAKYVNGAWTQLDATKLALKLTFNIAGTIVVSTSVSGATPTWVNQLTLSSSALTIVPAVTLSNPLTSNVAIGTPPFNVTSTTQVANLNVAQLGGHPASDFQLASSAATWTYDSGWTTVAIPGFGSNTYTFTHNLNAIPRTMVVMYKLTAAANASFIVQFSSPQDTGGGAGNIIHWFSDLNNFKIKVASSASSLGLDNTGATQATGQYRVFLGV